MFTKRLVKRGVSALVAICLLATCLCGCSIGEWFSVEKVNVADDDMHYFSGNVDCYSEPSLNSDVAKSFANGLSVAVQEKLTIDGIDWYRTEHGWIPEVLEQSGSEETQAPTETEPVDLNLVGFVTGNQLRVRSGPGVESDMVGELATGTRVVIKQLFEASDGPWGETEQGWIYMEHVYIPGDVTSRAGYVVARVDTSAFDAILQPKTAVYTIYCGDRLNIMHYITFEGDTRWAYTDKGWIDLREFYLEGEQGFSNYTGYVTTTEYLNVRRGPGTGFDAVSSLAPGSRVNIMEMIYVRNETWGYTGAGWVLMDYIGEEYEVPRDSSIGGEDNYNNYDDYGDGGSNSIS